MNALRYTHAHDYAASTAVDLVAAFRAVSQLSKPAAALRPLAAGNLVVKTSAGATATLAISAGQVAAGAIEFVECTALDATNACPVRVYW